MTGVKNSQFNFSHLNLMTATNAGVILADGKITPFSLLMANTGTGEPLLTLVSSGSWPLDQTLARDTRP